MVSHPADTTVRITDFFKAIPVRKQLANKDAPKCLANIKSILCAYALARPKVRFSMKVLKVKSSKDDFTYAPKPGSGQVDGAASQIFKKQLSSRGKDMNELISIHKERLRACNKYFRKTKQPFICLNIMCPELSYDGNIEPAKDDVLFVDRSKLYAATRLSFDAAYPSKLAERVQLMPPGNNRLTEHKGFNPSEPGDWEAECDVASDPPMRIASSSDRIPVQGQGEMCDYTDTSEDPYLAPIASSMYEVDEELEAIAEQAKPPSDDEEENPYGSSAIKPWSIAKMAASARPDLGRKNRPNVNPRPGTSQSMKACSIPVSSSPSQSQSLDCFQNGYLTGPPRPTFKRFEEKKLRLHRPYKNPVLGVVSPAGAASWTPINVPPSRSHGKKMPSASSSQDIRIPLTPSGRADRTVGAAAPVSAAYENEYSSPSSHTGHAVDPGTSLVTGGYSCAPAAMASKGRARSRQGGPEYQSIAHPCKSDRRISEPGACHGGGAGAATSSVDPGPVALPPAPETLQSHEGFGSLVWAKGGAAPSSPRLPLAKRRKSTRNIPLERIPDDFQMHRLQICAMVSVDELKGRKAHIAVAGTSMRLHEETSEISTFRMRATPEEMRQWALSDVELLGARLKDSTKAEVTESMEKDISAAISRRKEVIVID
ncbi:hypothetical protein EJ06DRAFT_549124 [Trichodelitschia bisporula]|uniref:Uncharacterized protein n=1 Tax=Trichodelitschia bisporula TaxID=703511 RepID=A0A6G1HX41_9PEZI|nr:hypothetical protein EJ06DRAFT_549124 [Trichodelitschia bisporula]